MKFGKTLARNQIPEWSRHYLSYKGLKKEIKNSVAALACGESAHADIVTGFLFHLDREVEKVNGFFVYKRAELERRLRILSEKARKVADINSMALNSLRITDMSPAVAALGSPATSKPPALSIVTNKAASTTNKNPAAVAAGAPAAPATAIPGVISSASAGTPIVPPSPFISDPEADAECLKAIVETKEMIAKLIWFAEMNRRAIEKILKKFDKNIATVCKDDYMTTKANLQPFVMDGRLLDLSRKTNVLYNEVSAVVSDHPPPELRSRSSRPEARMGLTDDEIVKALDAIEKDDVDTLRSIIDKVSSTAVFKDTLNQAQSGRIGRLPKSFFRRACQKFSFKCISLLMSLGAGGLIVNVNINEQSILHKLAIEGGHLALTPDDKEALPGLTRPAPDEGTEEMVQRDDPTLVEFILKELSSNTYTDTICTLKSTADITGRRPLHYAAIHGFPRIAKALLTDLQTSGEFVDFSSPYWLDSDGFTPVIYAVTRGNAQVLEVLIDQGGITDVDTVTNVGGTHSSMPKTLPSTPLAVLNPFAGSELNIHAAYTYTPLSIACRLGHTEVVKLLIHRGANLDAQDEDGESCLIVAAKNGHMDCVQLLIEGGANLELRERYYGWTALHLAAIENHPETVRTLLQAGANPNVYDFSSWTPHEHAIFAANNGCAALLRPVTLSLDERQRLKDTVPAMVPSPMMMVPDGDFSPTESFIRPMVTTPPVASQVTTLDGNSTPLLSSTPLLPGVSSSPPPSSGRASPPINSRANVKASKTTVQRAYGHKYLVDESLIVVTLGSNDIRNTVEAIELYLDGMENHFLTASTAFSLEITAENATAGEKAIIDLPIKDSWHEPIAFYAENPEQTILHFSIYPTFGGGSMQNKKVGRGTALLSSLDNLRKDIRGQHPHMTPLHGMNMTVPIFGTQNMDIIGRVRVELTVVRPFKHENLNVGSKHTYWKSLTTTVIGHRGLGMNRRVPNLQVGENTLLSFVTAASLGAEYIEFDVQMTKDMVPVLYHDWTVTETGLDIPVSAITVDQFQKLSRTNRGRDGKGGTHPTSRPGSPRSDSTISNPPSSASSVDGSRLQAPERPPLLRSPSSTSTYSNLSNGTLSKESPHNARLIRSNSLSSLPKGSAQQARAGLVVDASIKMKGNSAGTIQAPFATLKDTFETVPEHTGFNIEVKYPMLDEAEDANIPLYCHEMNLFVDRILKEVYDHDKTHPERKIIFSSFHPDICLLLNLKQPNYPVFFLTDGGTAVMADRRCNSLQEAVRFATSIDLLGIVTASPPIIEAPNLVKGIKQTGLLVFTYGAENNDIENAKLQRRHGVDAVIVDCVLAVRKGLSMAN